MESVRRLYSRVFLYQSADTFVANAFHCLFYNETRKIMKKLVVFVCMLGTAFTPYSAECERQFTHTIEETVRVDDWQLLIKALIHVESRGNSNAVGKCDDVGVLQITPIYLQEVNRICREERYTLSDRYDSLASVEMFEIYQNHHNSTKDIMRAIQLHNPRASHRYADSVMKTIDRLRYE